MGPRKSWKILAATSERLVAKHLTFLSCASPQVAELQMYVFTSRGGFTLAEVLGALHFLHCQEHHPRIRLTGQVSQKRSKAAELAFPNLFRLRPILKGWLKTCK